MVVEPVVPASAVPFGLCTAMGTFLSRTVSRTKLPPVGGNGVLSRAVMMPTGVLVIEKSRNVMEPAD